ncbi:MAG: TfoX/Sxy family protein [Hyphomicrobiales bacterium]|nr:TfoX/Sxy family protein [Hyphomicrobiales bacterium]
MMDAAALEDLFGPFARVALKRMFSGYGVYVGNACFAVAVDGGLYIKVDDEAERAALQAAEARPFAYTRSDGKMIAVASFLSLPEEAFDDEDALRRWCAPALAAAQRSAAEKARKLTLAREKAGGAQRKQALR